MRLSSNKKALSVFALVMINVIAIDSLRTLPMSAEYGFSIVFYYLMAAIFFFIPTALVSAELATAWPETGGVYVWVREAFGKKLGFLTIWLQWFYNICWYPTIMSLVAATIAYTFNPQLVYSKWYMLSVIMTVFWGATFVNACGMRASSVLTNFSAIIGTLVPMLFVIILGFVWVFSGHQLATPISMKAFFPDLSHVGNLVLLTAVLYGFAGMEMSASHAKEVNNPQRDYPKAMIWSVFIILLSMTLGTLAIEVVVPVNQLNIVSGLLEAFALFFSAFHMQWVMPIVAALIVFGAIGGAAAWMIGPSKGMLVASQDGCLPERLGKLNRKNAPIYVLLLQGGIFTVLCSVFWLLPTVSSGFWALTDVTSMLSLVVYVMMFSAAIYLRYKYPDVKRAFRIPGGKIGLWMVCLFGLCSSLVTIALGFFPPSQISVGNLATYEAIIVIGFVVGCLLPFGLYALTRALRKQERL